MFVPTKQTEHGIVTKPAAIRRVPPNHCQVCTRKSCKGPNHHQQPTQQHQPYNTPQSNQQTIKQQVCSYKNSLCLQMYARPGRHRLSPLSVHPGNYRTVYYTITRYRKTRHRVCAVARISMPQQLAPHKRHIKLV